MSDLEAIGRLLAFVVLSILGIGALRWVWEKLFGKD